jgi:hypothetical protein
MLKMEEETFFKAYINLNQPIDMSKVKIDTEGNSGSRKDGTVIAVTPHGEIWVTLYK